MKRKTVLSTGQVAAHCQVSYETVANWIKSGKLKSYTTPGRHHRIHLSDFRAFLNEHDMPPFEEEIAAKQRILVVDDEPNMVRLITNILSTTHKYDLDTAHDGFEAGIQILKFRPDLVILDLMMPNIDGFKVCKKIKSTPETKHILVLVVTGYATDENLQKAQEYGADYCMAKPIKMDGLIEKVEDLLEQRHKTTRSIPLTA